MTELAAVVLQGLQREFRGAPLHSLIPDEKEAYAFCHQQKAAHCVRGGQPFTSEL